MIRGELVSLRPLTLEDKELFFQWATNSDATPFWYGDIFNEPVPDRNKFFDDFPDYYFTGDEPLKGRSYAIVLNRTGEDIGQVNYQPDQYEKSGEAFDLDILIASKKNMEKGYGTRAISLLIDYLRRELGLKRFTVYTHPTNQRAIRSYEKAGFVFEKVFTDEHNVTSTKLFMDFSNS
jgi:RimJ/RimL family protein N-acetyltransferase